MLQSSSITGMNILPQSRCNLGTGKISLAASPSRRLQLVAAATPSDPTGDKSSGGRRRGDGGRSRQSQPNNHSKRGSNFEKQARRKGRPEWLRKPDDSPLRDGNRDRLIGLVTLRAARTLAYYLTETSPVVYHWLNKYIIDHPIPRDGAWDDVCGDTFLRTLLKMPSELTSGNWGRSELHSSGRGMQVDPRSIAQRIMEIRSQIALEMVQDLAGITEENNHLMRETIMASFSLNLDNVVAHPTDAADTP